jgi:NADH-quinone oxidoreductase subunit G
MSAPNPPELVELTIDGHLVMVPKGANLIDVAQQHGHYIPRFCWHERMKPVGMCRMCLVEIEGVRGLPPACTSTVTPGMVVHTQESSPNARKAQEGVLEFLLINHPLDCPVCDRGGECPLQDHTIAHGPAESRFVEEKRHHAKPIPISHVVDLDRERCILCARCTRFADEIAGDPLISFVERGGHSQVLNFPDDPFSSYFSGNTVQICPVGALTAKPYRFRARPWDLEKAETSCTTCAVQCRGELHSTTNQLVRLLGVDSDAVNHGWLCDKGRFGYEWVASPERITAPLVRKTGSDGTSDLVEVSWPEALDAAAHGLKEVLRLHQASGLGVLGGARGTNEDAYVWSRFAKSVLGTDNVDCQLGDGLPAEVVLGLPRATIADCDRSRVVVLLAPDLKEELPVLYLRLKRAATDLGVKLIEIGATATGLTHVAAATVRHLPGSGAEVVARMIAAASGTPAGDPEIDAAAAVLGDGSDVVVVLGRANLAESADATVAAAASLAGLPGVRFLSALRRGNVHGALDMGLAPGILPGRVSLGQGRATFAHAWGSVPAEAGRDGAAMMRAAADGKLHGLVLLGADPMADFPDRALAERAMASIGFTVVVDGFLSESAKRADVVLPPALWGEKSGSATNTEGRVQRLSRRVTAAGRSMDDWRIAVELAARFDVDFDLETVEEVQAEIARLAPAYHGVDSHVINGSRDGVVVPLAPVAVSVGRRSVSEPTEPDEAADTSATTPAIATAAGAAPSGPDLLVWDRAAPDAPATPRDSYAVRLVVARTLYDGGRVVAQGPSIVELAPGARLELNPSELERLGVVDGGSVRATSSRGSAVMKVTAATAVPAGTARMAHNQPGDVSDLVDVSSPVTDLRLESVAVPSGTGSVGLAKGGGR